MSDYQRPADRSNGVPIWGAILIAVILALIAALGVFLFMRSTAAADEARISTLEKENTSLRSQVASLTSQVTSLSAAISARDSAVPTGTGTAKEPENRSGSTAKSSVRQFCQITKVGNSSGTYKVTVDYEALLTGKAATDEAKRRGLESPPPNDYLILNDNHKLRTFKVASDADVRVLNWDGKTGTDATGISMGQFMDVMPGGTNPQTPWKNGYYYITIEDATTVTKVEQQYFP